MTHLNSSFSKSLMPPDCVAVTVSVQDKEQLFQLSLNKTVGEAKTQILEVLGRDLPDSVNYGLYLPATAEKVGKFLQDERPLRDYPFHGVVAYLELRYKKRVYKTSMNPSKMKKLHARANLQQFLRFIVDSQIEKMNKWLTKGLDPNFHCRSTGETPLTLAVAKTNAPAFIVSLVSQGAHLDFRNKEGLTPLHVACVKGNLEAVKTLLELGQSPNTRDLKGLTPLYLSVMHDEFSRCAERLLFDYSILNVADENGLLEIHQACRFGRVQHLELLITYGADMNAQTQVNGNAPLHICAYLGQEACARLLLFRGARKDARNRAGHTPLDQALLSKHETLVKLIKNFRHEDVVPLKGSPLFNQRRRVSVPGSARCAAGVPRTSSANRIENRNGGDVSGVLASCAIPKLMTNSASSAFDFDDSLSDVSTSLHSGNQSLQNSQRSNNNNNNFLTSSGKTFNFREKKPSGGSGSGRGDRPGMGLKSGTAGGNGMDLHHSSNLVSGLSKSMCNLDELNEDAKKPVQKLGDTTVECRKAPPALPARSGGVAGHLPHQGCYTATLQRHSRILDYDSASSAYMGFMTPNLKKNKFARSFGNLNLIGNTLDSDMCNVPRAVVLQKSDKGDFGFIMRSSLNPEPAEFHPTLECPALNCIEAVCGGSPAEQVGLKSGDFILQVNGVTVISQPHEMVKRQILQSGNTLSMKVLTVEWDPDEDDDPYCELMSTARFSSRLSDYNEANDVATAQPRHSSLTNRVSSSSSNGGGMGTAQVRTRYSRQTTMRDVEELYARSRKASPEKGATEVAPLTTFCASAAAEEHSRGHKELDYLSRLQQNRRASLTKDGPGGHGTSSGGVFIGGGSGRSGGALRATHRQGGMAMDTSGGDSGVSSMMEPCSVTSSLAAEDLQLDASCGHNIMGGLRRGKPGGDSSSSNRSGGGMLVMDSPRSLNDYGAPRGAMNSSTTPVGDGDPGTMKFFTSPAIHQSNSGQRPALDTLKNYPAGDWHSNQDKHDLPPPPAALSSSSATTPSITQATNEILFPPPPPPLISNVTTSTASPSLLRKQGPPPPPPPSGMFKSNATPNSNKQQDLQDALSRRRERLERWSSESSSQPSGAPKKMNTPHDPDDLSVLLPPPDTFRDSIVASAVSPHMRHKGMPVRGQTNPPPPPPLGGRGTTNTGLKKTTTGGVREDKVFHV